MLEGKEVEGKIGEVGSYSVDVTPELKVEAALAAELKKDLMASVPGGLEVEFAVTAKIKSDPVAIALFEIQKMDNPVAKFLGAELAKLRAGEAPHPAVAAAAAPEAPAVPADAPQA